jgi:riboflavin synthase
MFTGIIEGMGVIDAIRSAGEGRQLTISADFDLDGTRIGDSISVNGACLTAVRLKGRRFDVDVSPETVARTTIGSATVGDRVNLERALRLGDRLDGHLVSGHVDGQGILTSRESAANALVLTFQAGPDLMRYMIQKGSVAIDGVSLTINQLRSDHFQVSIIPHTAMLTTIGRKRVGQACNIETDLIGKYVERFVKPGEPSEKESAGGVDLGLLAKSGFLDS